jgi:hypothetical protein
MELSAYFDIHFHDFLHWGSLHLPVSGQKRDTTVREAAPSGKSTVSHGGAEARPAGFSRMRADFSQTSFADLRAQRQSAGALDNQGLKVKE